MADKEQGTPNSGIATPTVSPETPEQAIHIAQQTVFRLQRSLRCHGCGQELPHAQPWRSRSCEHLFCASCARIARGNIPQNATPEARRLAGHCPVSGCGVPLQPVDVVEDFVVWQIVDACAALAAWANATPPTAAVQAMSWPIRDNISADVACARTGGVVVSGDQLFNEDITLS